MNTELTLDKGGRVVLPKSLRDRLELQPGDRLEVETAGDQILLKPVRLASPLRKDRGVWVYRTGAKISQADADRTLDRARADRDAEVIGTN